MTEYEHHLGQPTRQYVRLQQHYLDTRASLRGLLRRVEVPKMAETLPSPPISRSSTMEPHTDDDTKPDMSEDIAAKLDSLLEQYLNLLDKYTTLREELSKTFSNGFFSLAQAQRNSTLGPGRRYGQDFYDQRMKGRRRTAFTVTGDQVNVSIRLVNEQKVKEHKETGKNENGENQEPEDESGGAGIQEVDDNDESSQKEEDAEKQKAKEKTRQDPGTRDPLMWFGLLVPPALRQTQSHFSEAVEHAMPALVNIDDEMKRLEEQIWRCRKYLADSLGNDAEIEPVDATELEKPDLVQQESKNEATTSSRKSRLAQRPVHARSQLLKLGD